MKISIGGCPPATGHRQDQREKDEAGWALRQGIWNFVASKLTLWEPTQGKAKKGNGCTTYVEAL